MLTGRDGRARDHGAGWDAVAADERGAAAESERAAGQPPYNNLWR